MQREDLIDISSPLYLCFILFAGKTVAIVLTKEKVKNILEVLVIIYIY